MHVCECVCGCECIYMFVGMGVGVNVSVFLPFSLQVSQAAEDTFSLLAPALPPELTIELLSPMTAKEKYPMLLGVIKLLTKVDTHTHHMLPSHQYSPPSSLTPFPPLQ